MRIAIAINTSWNIYNFRRGLIDALREDGHELVLIAPPDAYSDKIKTWGRIKSSASLRSVISSIVPSRP
ncbi:MAG: hypothetical protein AAGC88_06100, partial [Bacteroidota bacterium]